MARGMKILEFEALPGHSGEKSLVFWRSYGAPEELSKKNRMESPMELKSWPVFANIEVDFLAKVKSVWVFRSWKDNRVHGEDAMILTNEDEMYALGPNLYGKHGVGDTQPARNPRKVPALSHKKVVEISLGFGFSLALTQDGTIYSWGENDKGQLGRKTTNHGLIPMPIEGPLRGKMVTSIACGKLHSLALTDSGEVFAWGSNTFGQLGYGSQNASNKVPQKIQFEHLVPKECHAQQISCGAFSSIILLNDGRILSFGHSNYDQLGLGNNENQSTPLFIKALRQTKIVSVSCGFCHVLALSDMGHLYSWGANNFGQLGNGISTDDLSVPTRIGDEKTRFTAIETNWASYMSAALNQSNKTYVWGECKGGEILTTPTETQYKSLPEAFYFHSNKEYSMYPKAIRFTSSGTSESQPRSSTCCSQCDELKEQVKSLQLQLSTTQNAVAKLMEQVKLLQLRLSVTQNAVEATECKICYESHNGKPWVLVPCGHSGFCETCAKTFANESNGAGSRPMGCPFCRKEVVMTMQLHA